MSYLNNWHSDKCRNPCYYYHNVLDVVTSDLILFIKQGDKANKTQGVTESERNRENVMKERGQQNKMIHGNSR